MKSNIISVSLSIRYCLCNDV